VDVCEDFVQLLCVGGCQEVVKSPHADVNLSQVPHDETSPPSHIKWHVHLPSNETDDAQVYRVFHKKTSASYFHHFPLKC